MPTIVNTTTGEVKPVGTADPNVDEEAMLELAHLKAAFHRIFNLNNADTKLVLGWFMAFCRANETVARFDPTGRYDPYASTHYAGRHEVWVKMQEFLQLSTEDQYKLFNSTMRKVR